MKNSLVLLVVAAFTISGCKPEKFDQVSYFKGDNRNRIFVLKARAAVSDDDVRREFERLMHTDGRMTLAYFYTHEVEGLRDFVTRSPDFMSANDVMFEVAPAWKWWARHSPNGEITIINCAETPGNTICSDQG